MNMDDSWRETRARWDSERNLASADAQSARNRSSTNQGDTSGAGELICLPFYFHSITNAYFDRHPVARVALGHGLLVYCNVGFPAIGLIIFTVDPSISNFAVVSTLIGWPIFSSFFYYRYKNYDNQVLQAIDRGTKHGLAASLASSILIGLIAAGICIKSESCDDQGAQSALGLTLCLAFFWVSNLLSVYIFCNVYSKSYAPHQGALREVNQAVIPPSQQLSMDAETTNASQGQTPFWAASPQSPLPVAQPQSVPQATIVK